MSDITYNIGEMLDGLKMTTAAIRWKQLLNDPELGNFTAQQLLREVITPQYVEAMNKQYATNLKFSRLMEKSARIENLKTGNGRKYRYAKAMGYDVSEKADFSAYPDSSDVSDWAKEAMQWAVGTGIIQGKDGGTYLDPQGNASRAECATMVMRFMQKYVEG